MPKVGVFAAIFNKENHPSLKLDMVLKTGHCQVDIWIRMNHRSME
jgi:hypothetical protein